MRPRAGNNRVNWLRKYIGAVGQIVEGLSNYACVEDFSAGKFKIVSFCEEGAWYDDALLCEENKLEATI